MSAPGGASGGGVLNGEIKPWGLLFGPILMKRIGLGGPLSRTDLVFGASPHEEI